METDHRDPVMAVVSACAGAFASSNVDSGIGGPVWLGNEDGNSITVITAATNHVITTLIGIEGLQNLQIAPNGNTIGAVSGHEAGSHTAPRSDRPHGYEKSPSREVPSSNLDSM